MGPHDFNNIPSNSPFISTFESIWMKSIIVKISYRMQIQTPTLPHLSESTVCMDKLKYRQNLSKSTFKRQNIVTMTMTIQTPTLPHLSESGRGCQWFANLSRAHPPVV